MPADSGFNNICQDKELRTEYLETVPKKVISHDRFSYEEKVYEVESKCQ